MLGLPWFHLITSIFEGLCFRQKEASRNNVALWLLYTFRYHWHVWNEKSPQRVFIFAYCETGLSFASSSKFTNSSFKPLVSFSRLDSTVYNFIIFSYPNNFIGKLFNGFFHIIIFFDFYCKSWISICNFSSLILLISFSVSSFITWSFSSWCFVVSK